MKTRDRVMAPIEWMKDTLASAGQAIADSDFFWLIDEIAWPLIQVLGILLALFVGGLIWLWMILPGNRKGASDNGDVFPDPYAVDWEAIEYDFQRARYLNDEGPAPN